MSTSYRAQVYLGIFVTRNDFIAIVTDPIQKKEVTSCSHSQALGKSFCSSCGKRVTYGMVDSDEKRKIWKPSVMPFLTPGIQENPDWGGLSYYPEEPPQVGKLRIFRVSNGRNDLGTLLGFRLANIDNNPIESPLKISAEDLAINIKMIRYQADLMGIEKPIEQVMLLGCWC